MMGIFSSKYLLIWTPGSVMPFSQLTDIDIFSNEKHINSHCLEQILTDNKHGLAHACWVIFQAFVVVCWHFSDFQNQLFRKIISAIPQNVKKFESRSGPNVLTVLILVQFEPASKGYQKSQLHIAISEKGSYILDWLVVC